MLIRQIEDNVGGPGDKTRLDVSYLLKGGLCRQENTFYNNNDYVLS